MLYERKKLNLSRSVGHELWYVCMHCKKTLNPWEEERGYAFCNRCLNQLFTQKSNRRVLLISINGKSTPDDFLELQRWKHTEKNF